VRVYGESDSLFHKGLALRVGTGNAHVYLHYDALATASRTWGRRWVRYLAHESSTI
jgi:hypothetical protein